MGPNEAGGPGGGWVALGRQQPEAGGSREVGLEGKGCQGRCIPDCGS